MKKKINTIYYLMLFLAAIIWGSSFVVVKSSVQGLPPNMLIFLRFSTACVLLSLIFIKQLKKFKKSVLIKGILCGLFLFIGYTLQTIGIVYTTPGKNAFLTAIYCVLVPFLFWGVGKIKPDRYNIIAAVLCLAGIGFIAIDGTLGINIGDLLTIISGIAFAGHIVFVAMSARNENPILLTIVQFGAVAVFSLFTSLLTEPKINTIAFSTQVILEVAYLAVFATAAALLLQIIGQSKVNPSTVSLIVSFEAVFGVLFSIIFFDEKITLRISIGFIFVFIAIIISETKMQFLRKKQKKIKER